MRPLALTVNVPHLEVDFLQIPHPLCGVKQGATQSDVLQPLSQAETLVVVEPKLNCFLLILLQQQHCRVQQLGNKPRRALCMV